jgi:hypothetical protein
MAECTDIERALLDALREDSYASADLDRALDAGAPGPIQRAFADIAALAERHLEAVMLEFIEEIFDGDRNAQ